MQLVGFTKIFQDDPSPVERLTFDLFAVQFTTVDRRRQKIDERVRARLMAEEMNGRLAGERVRVLGEIE